MNDYNDQPLHRLEPAYLEHYGLAEPPFSAVVDERFYFSTAESSQRLSLLVHMTQYSDMLLMVLGDEGMGKSSLLQNYIKSAHDNWHICRINANSMMDKEQLLFRIAEDFSLETLPADSTELVEMLYDKMTQLHQNDVLPVIIVDDAHELPADAVSQLFIMAEIKAGDTSMVHIILFAEPIIEKTLNASVARKIRERIGHVFELTPFDEADTAEYILSRMTVAGLNGPNPFSPKVVRQIHKQSHGNPARINELAHIALDEGSDENAAPEFNDVYDDEIKTKADRFLTPTLIITFLLIAAVAGVGYWQQERINALFTTSPVADVKPLAPRGNEPGPFARLKEKLIRLGGDKPPAVENKPAPDNPPPAASIERVQDPAIAAQLQNTEQPSPAPVIERVEPATLIAGDDQQTITLHGRHFSPDSTVTLIWSGNKKVLPSRRVRLEGDNRISLVLNTGTKADNWSVLLKTPTGQTASAKFKVIAAASPKPAAPPKPAATAKSSMEWIQSQPATNVTLQLLGSHHLKPLNNYVAKFKLGEEAVIHTTRHNNKDWYILLYGSYADSKQALQAIDSIPPTAKQNKPWIRSFASLRAEKPAAASRKAPAKTAKAAPPPPKPAANSPSVSQTAASKAPKLNNIRAHEAWIWSQDPSHYTLQLLGTQNIDKIKQFIDQHQLRGKVVYYHTQRNKQDWYALVYGVYPKNTDAHSAAKELPPTLKGFSPWVRNFAAIHAEMDKTRQ